MGGGVIGDLLSTGHNPRVLTEVFREVLRRTVDSTLEECSGVVPCRVLVGVLGRG